MPLEHLCCGTKSFIQVGGSYNSIPVSCCSNIGTMYCTFVCLINIMLPAIFVYKPFFQNKVFQVCPCLVLVVILLLFISVGAASSNFTRDRVVCWYRFRVTLIRVFSASRSCPSYWLRSSPDQIYQQYYYK